MIEKKYIFSADQKCSKKGFDKKLFIEHNFYFYLQNQTVISSFTLAILFFNNFIT